MYYQVKYLPDSIETHVVCERTDNLDQFPARHIHCLEQRPGWESISDRILRKLGLRTHLGLLNRVIREIEADAVHFHFAPLACNNMTATRGTSVKTFVTFYGLDVNQLPQQKPGLLDRYQLMFAEVDGVLCEGPFMANSVANLGCPREKLHVHHLGVPLDNLPFEPRQWQPGTPLRLLIASSFFEKKGIPYALQAIARLAREMPVELTLIGDAPGPRGADEKQRILETIGRSGLKDATSLPGYVSHAEMLQLARQHHVFVATSVTASNGDSEGGAPVALIEMAASGMPIISSRHCDIPNVVLDGETGLLSDERDVDDIYTNLRWLADHPERWLAMLTASRRRIEEQFDCARQGQKLADLYFQLAGIKPV